MHADADVVRDLGVLERVRVSGELLVFRRFGPKTFGMSTAVFSRTAFAEATWPTSQPARVNGTHGAGVVVSGATGRAAVAGGTGA